MLHYFTVEGQLLTLHCKVHGDEQVQCTIVIQLWQWIHKTLMDLSTLLPYMWPRQLRRIITVHVCIPYTSQSNFTKELNQQHTDSVAAKRQQSGRMDEGVLLKVRTLTHKLISRNEWRCSRAAVGPGTISDRRDRPRKDARCTRSAWKITRKWPTRFYRFQNAKKGLTANEYIKMQKDGRKSNTFYISIPSEHRHSINIWIWFSAMLMRLSPPHK